MTLFICRFVRHKPIDTNGFLTNKIQSTLLMRKEQNAI